MPIKFSVKSPFMNVVSLLFLIVFSANSIAKTELHASVSETNIQLGDVITLTISLNDSNHGYELDTTELRQVFNVSRPSKSNQTQYINGEFSQQTQWKMALRAKQLGVVMIPSFEMGPFKTNPIKINVRKVSDQVNKSKTNLAFMENSLNKSSLYIGQSVILTTKIYLLKQSNDLSLMTPNLTDAEIVIIPEDKTGRSTINGKSYQTVTRQYKITPTKTGQFKIASPLLNGSIRNIVNINAQNRLVEKTINVRGSTVALTVKPQPESFKGEWLISEDVRLFDNSEFSQQEIHVGDPITRKITLQIASIDKSQLPSVKLNYPSNIRFYPDKDEISEGQAKNGLTYAVRTMSHAIIADQAGSITLPEIKIAWWNSKTDKQAFTTIPKRVLTVLPALKGGQSNNDSSEFVVPKKEVKTITRTVTVESHSLIYWQIATFFLLLLLVLMVSYHFYYRQKLTTENSKSMKVIRSDNNLDHLIAILKNNNPKTAYRALLVYAQSQCQDLKSISAFPEKTALSAANKNALKQEIKRLELSCITEKTSWNSQKLIELITLISNSTQERDKSSLTRLNPTDKR
jgi:hypothetical protein